MSGVVQEGYVPGADALVGGVSRPILSASVTHGFKQLVSTCHLELDPNDGRPAPGTEVRLRGALAGRTAALMTVFTGEVDTSIWQYAPWSAEVQASGILARCKDALGTPDIDNGDGTFTPAIGYDNQTRGAIITDLLSRYGITRVNISDSGEVIGTINTVYLQKEQPALDLIQQLDEDEGYITFEGPDGTVFRISVTGVPSGGAARTWVEGADIYTGTLQETREGTINRVTASGAPQTGTTGLDFTPTDTIDAPSPWIPDPPKYRPIERNSAYFETADQCTAYCLRKLGELNRLRGEVPFSLARPDLGLRAGMTVALTSAKLDSDNRYRYWVQEVTHTFDGSGINTSGVLLLASAGAGFSANQHPVAVIDLHQETETLADGSQLTTVATDGSASYDPDGDGGIYNGIVSYVWGGTATTHSVVPGSGGQKATYAISGDPTGLTVTLTVTDANGATGSTTRTLGSADTPVVTRDLWSAEGTALSFSLDGGKTWTDVSVAAVIVARVSAEDFTLAVTAAGALYRVTVDAAGALTATLLASPTGVTAVSINTIGGSSRCWAGDSSGGVWFSPDSGQTWTQAGTVPNTASIKRIEESPYQNGDLTALAGNIAYHSFSAGAGWDVLYTAPAGATVTDFVSGFDDGFISWDGTLAAGEPSRIQERNGNVVGNWNQAGPAPIDAPGAHPAALTLGVGAPVLVAVGTAPDDTPQTWWADASGDFTFARGVYMAAWGNPHDIIRDGQIDGLIYGAADNALFKTTDFFQSTAYKLKALAAGRTGYMIGYGKLRAFVPPTIVPAAGALLMCAFDAGTSAEVVLQLNASGWAKLSDHPYTGSGTRKLLVAGGIYYTWVTTAPGAGNAVGANNVWRSADGASWTQITTPGSGGLRDLAGGSDGALWGITNAGDAVYHSTDAGVSWTLAQSGRFGEVSDQPLMRLAVSPVDPATVAVAILSFVALSTDGLATHSMSGRTEDAIGQSAGPSALAWLASGAGIVHQHGASDAPPQVIRTASWGTVTSILDVDHQMRQGVPVTGGLAMGTEGGVYRSTDDGATWTAESSGPAGALVSYAIDGAGNEYAAERVFSPATSLIWQRTPDGAWTDITAGLLAAFPANIYQCHDEGMVGQ